MKKKLIAIIGILLFHFTTTLPMAPVTQTMLNGFKTVCTVGSLFPFLKETYVNWRDIGPKKHECYNVAFDATEEESQFVRDICDERGIQEQIETKYMCCAHTAFDAEYANNTVYISYYPSAITIEGENKTCIVYEDGDIGLFRDHPEADEYYARVEFIPTIQKASNYLLNLKEALYLHQRLRNELAQDGISEDNQSVLLAAQQKLQLCLDKHSAVIQHELGHHVHKSSHRLLLANAIIPIVAHTLLTTYAATYCPETITCLWDGVACGCIHAGASLMSASISKAIISWGTRRDEAAADSFLVNDPKILEASKQSFEDYKQSEAEDCSECEYCQSCEGNTFVSRNMNKLYESKIGKFLFDTHPSYDARIAAIEKRLSA